MLTAKLTAQAGGYHLSGDLLDLEALYSSLHAICEDQSEGERYPENLIFQLAYDVRKSRDGHRGVAKVPGFGDKPTVYRAVTLSLARALIQFGFIIRLVRGRHLKMKHTASVHAFGATVVEALEQLKFPAPERFLASVVESVDSWSKWPDAFVVDSLDRDFLYGQRTRAARLKVLKRLPQDLRRDSRYAVDALKARDDYARQHGIASEDVGVAWPDEPPRY